MARVVEAATAGRHHQALLDSTLSGLAGLLDENRALMRQKLAEQSPWWVPEPIDDRLFRKFFDGVQGFIAEVRRDPDHELRHQLDARMADLAVRLRTDPVLIARGEELKDELLRHPEVQAWLDSLWRTTKESILAVADDPDSDLRRRLDAGLVRAGRSLQEDPALQAKVDGWVERVVTYLAEEYGHEIADLIATTVARWDGAEASRRIELQVGRDLQFIRINGTVVGGLAGLIIYSVGQFLCRRPSDVRSGWGRRASSRQRDVAKSASSAVVATSCNWTVTAAVSHNASSPPEVTHVRSSPWPAGTATQIAGCSATASLEATGSPVARASDTRSTRPARRRRTAMSPRCRSPSPPAGRPRRSRW